MDKHVKAGLRLALPAALIAVVAFLLVRELSSLQPQQIVTALNALTWQQLLVAAAAASAAYGLLTLYDALALYHLRHRLGGGRIALTAFICYAFNFSLGPLVGGIGMRLRLYTRWGLAKGDVARITVFSALTTWCGYVLMTGFTLLVEPGFLAVLLGAPIAAVRAGGGLGLALAAAYVALCHYRQAPLQFGQWHLRLPRVRVACAQLALSCLQWSLVCLTIYALLPLGSGISYARIVCVYLSAAIVGLASHVPGGLGVIEGVFVLLLTPDLSREVVLGMLIAFRALYYLLPLLLAAAAYAGIELILRRRAVIPAS